MPDFIPNAPAAPEPSAPTPAPAASPAPSLENPRSQTLPQLNAALTAAEQQQAQPGAQPGLPAAQGQQPFDMQAFRAEMQAQEARFQKRLEKELGQARKAQGDFAKLPELIQKQFEAREKAQRERMIREQLSPADRLALMDQESDEAQRQKSIEELVARQVEARWQAQQAEQEGVRNYERALTSMAGERMGELEPHIMSILGRVDAALKSNDPEVVEQGLQYYDYYQQNMGALLWHADAALRQAGSQGGGQAAPAPQGQPAAAPPSQADQFRQQRQQAGAQASPQARSSAPNARPTSLGDMDPASFRNMDKGKLDQLLKDAEASTR